VRGRGRKQWLQIEKIAQMITEIETVPRAITAISKMRSSDMITPASQDKSSTTGFGFKDREPQN
jgi:hypothetical protein